MKMLSWHLCSVYASMLLFMLFSWAGPLFAEEKATAPSHAVRVLFVGNSQIFYNDLPQLLVTLADSAPPSQARIQVGRALTGGASLASHWDKGLGNATARSQIAEGKWDFVVLQEIYRANPESFDKHARLFHELVQRSGSQPLFFSTASISTMYPQGFHDLHKMHIELAKELKFPVVAAGNAWLSYWGENSTPEQRLLLYAPDKAHPGKKGSYVYACALYAAITGSSPVGLTHAIPSLGDNAVSAAEAKQYQEAAWRVHQETNGKDYSPQKK